MAVSEGNFEVIQHVIQQGPQVSVYRVTAQAGLRHVSTHRIMRHSFHLFPYRIETRQPLIIDDINARETSANAMLQQQARCCQNPILPVPNDTERNLDFLHEFVVVENALRDHMGTPSGSGHKVPIHIEWFKSFPPRRI